MNKKFANIVYPPKGHVFTFAVVNLIENTFELLEKKAIPEKVVATLIRKRAFEDNSTEFEMHTLKVRFLNGLWQAIGSASVTKEIYHD